MQSSANIETGYKNLIDCAVGVVNTQGVTGLYRGFGASIGTSAPSSAIFFATYEAVKKWTEVKFPHSLGKVGPIVAAAVGNVVASVVRVPPEVRGLPLCCPAHYFVIFFANRYVCMMWQPIWVPPSVLNVEQFPGGGSAFETLDHTDELMDVHRTPRLG